MRLKGRTCFYTYYFKKNGFTLIEFILTIAILGILLAIAVPLYGKWVNKERVVEDAKKIFTELNYLRLKSFSTKEEYSLCWSSTPFRIMIVKLNGGNIGSLKLKNNFTASLSGGYNCVDFSPDGTADHIGSIKVYGDSYGASVDCVKISRVRIILGKWNEESNSCESY